MTFVRTVLNLLLCSFGAAMMYAWDHHPALGVRIPVLAWRIGFQLPDSLAVQRDKAVAALVPARAQTIACRSVAQAQAASITAAAAASASRLDLAIKGLAGVERQVAEVRRTIPAMKAYVPKGPDACSQWEDADHTITKDLR